MIRTAQPRTSDEVTADIDALGQALQDRNLTTTDRTQIFVQLNTLREELTAAYDQEEITAAEIATWGRPEQYL